MFGLRTIASFRGSQLFNLLGLKRFCSLQSRQKLQNLGRSANEGSDESRIHNLTINPSDEITPEELNEKSTHEGWADTFGSLTGYSERQNLDEISDENSDKIDSHVRLSKTFRKHEPDWYGRKIESLGKAGKVYEAVQILEKDMLVDDRVMPNTYVFTTLIGILGRVGHVKKAFKLFNMMKKYGIKPDSPTYTALFNSCSNAYDKDDALKRALKLKELMKEQEVSVNIKTYQAMIKAFAFLGDTRMAFKILDEAIEAGEKPSNDTFSFLMMGAVADKEAGSSLAVKIWRKMRSKKLKFQEHHYNLLFRCIRDCGIGNKAVFNEMLYSPSLDAGKNLKLNSGSQPRQLEKPKIKDDIDNSNQLISGSNALVVPENMASLNFPNILNPKFDINRYPNWEISIPKDAPERLIFLGGVESLLNHMEKDNCNPTVKTFTLLMDLVQQNEESENDLFGLMKKYSLKPDLVMLNSLIKRRCLRKDFRSAKDVLSIIVEHGLKPDEKTFGCLSMGCSTEVRGMRLLDDMMKVNMLPNAEICNNLIFLSKMDFRYKLNILKFIKDNKLKLDVNCLRKLESSIKYAKYMILKAEREGTGNRFKSEEFLRRFEIFMMNYRQWLRSIEFEPEVDPSIRYDQPTPQVPGDDVVGNDPRQT